MDGDQKKSLKIAISEFYKLNFEKGKEYTILKYFKMEVYQEALIRRIKIKQKEIDQDIVIKIFENFKCKWIN